MALTEQVWVTYCVSSSLFCIGPSTDTGAARSCASERDERGLTIVAGSMVWAQIAATSDITAAV